LIVELINTVFRGSGSLVAAEETVYLARPKGVSRAPLPSEVPVEFAGDYTEACLVLSDSPKASAALSRRCLQHLLREKEPIKKGDLYDEIEEVLSSRNLPAYLGDDLDLVRVIGNFAAHPIKSKSTGEIFAVEPGEAEHLLNTLESLFDFYFVRPAVQRNARASVNEKLQAAGKPPVRTSSTESKLKSAEPGGSC